MRCSSISPASKPNCRLWLICVLSIWALNADAKIVLTVPHEVSLSPNTHTQQLSMSWLGGDAATFDVIILRTEFNETVFYDTVSATVNPMSGRHQWNWTSVEPLECTSLSIKIRSRDGQTTSEWSNTEILQGKDVPSEINFQMYPQDRIVPVGTNTTFCCIVEEGTEFAGMNYSSTVMKVKRLSRRTYASTVVNQKASGRTGTNVVCSSKYKQSLTGAVVFVGYPPQPTDFVCETYDLVSAVCRWKEGRNTYLHGKRVTRYSVNKRDCPKEGSNKCSFSQWDGNWTLVAVNPLGHSSLTDSAEISHRVCPVAPVDLGAVVHAWDATVMWKWTYKYSLPLVCQVELTNSGYNTKLIFTGVGLQSVVLSNLLPYEDYDLQVRCGAQKNFWKWGNWSDVFTFRTKSSAPDAPDVWMWMNRDNTGLVVWKPLTRLQSHGLIKRYKVTLCDPKEEQTCIKSLPPGTCSVPVNLTQLASFRSDNKVVATVTAENDAGVSQPAIIRLHLTDVEPPTLSRAVYTDNSFPLVWQHQANVTCSYVVEWHDATCSHDCHVEWIKVAAGSTNITVESDNFQPGVRYNFSLYSCPYDSPQKKQCWQGYMQELTPSRPVPLSVTQEGSSVVLTWGEIPLVDRRGFLLGYNVYSNNGFKLTLLANLSDPGARKFKVQGLSASSYKFTVKAYTSAGEDTGSTVSIMLERNIYQLILEMLLSLGGISIFLIIVTIICYKKRKWVKKAFYPDIPEPKLPGDWSRTQGPLNVKPSHHSLVHIVERPDQDSKEALVVIPEQDEDDDGYGIGDEPVDTDEPHSLRYYNHVVDERPIRPRFPDSSASSSSSMDSAHTDVTYTGIQTSGTSLVFQLDPQGSSEGHHPQVDQGVHCGAGGDYQPQMHPMASNIDTSLASPDPFLESQASNCGGYKPQNSWHLDSPTEACERSSLAPSLGSPTSVASTQFLLPDGEECGEEKRQLSSASTWFTNLLSSTKP
ncbi:LIF receptor subunit alpha a [Melanotaenia boesemani]|uniref:LIF receptor subunit alpha a n=1 Tax=Melanotaenia boesemani TaxID=1250792 RepID=UPI001C04F335|nr:LIF receptor subunit alpha a [Melanotaenia boesemani]